MKIRKRTYRLWVMLLFCSSVFSMGISAQEAALEEAHATPENIVKSLYELVTFKAGEMPDWDKVKNLFIEEAVIVLRLGPQTTRTFDRQSFIDYFILDIERAKLLETGFKESITKMQMDTVKDIAHCYAVYEVLVPGRNDDKPVNWGIDSFHLIKNNNRWWIASIINEGFRMNVPLPDFLNKK